MDSHKQQLISNSNYTELAEKEEEDVPLPGFRFHPTDEELVGFYLNCKVEKKPIGIELIKEIDVYKYDPWDLPKGSNVGEKEWYFFCRRGRKYRNSIRPNRVTGSGFWKATGIDRPIYSGDGSVCIGLKKSLVYYLGSAGKGTKTDWMMHEFRLPPPSNTHNNHQMDQKSVTQEAEVWTLCRILKRTPCHKKPLPEWTQVPTRGSTPAVDTSSGESDYDMQSYISFQATVTHENKPHVHNHHHQQSHGTNRQMSIGQLTTSVLTSDAPSATASCSRFFGLDVNDVIKHGDWYDLISVVNQFAVADPFFFA